METSTRDPPKGDGSAMRARGPGANPGHRATKTANANTTASNKDNGNKINDVYI